MKKMMTMGFAVLALTITSCSKNEMFDSELASNAITFKNMNDRLSTMSANDNDQNYGVYAFLNNGIPTASTWFMDNQEVNGKSNSYSPLKYWPKDGTVDFYSYAPYNSANLDLSTVVWNVTTPVFDFTYSVPAAADEDFTVATPQTGLSAAQVQLVFSHMLSKVEFVADLSDDLKNDGFEITLNSTNLKVAFDKGSNSLSNPGVWTALTLDGSGTYSGSNGYIIMPQPAPDTEIALNVKITHNGADYFEGTLKTLVLTEENLTDFDRKTRYLFTITVGDLSSDDNDNPIFNVIEFISNVAPWDQSPILVPQI